MKFNDSSLPASLGQVLGFPAQLPEGCLLPRRGPRGVEYFQKCADCDRKDWYPRNTPVLACEPIGVRCFVCTARRKAAREAERRLAAHEAERSLAAAAAAAPAALPAGPGQPREE